MVLAAHTDGSPPRLSSLAPDVAAQLGMQLFLAALAALPADQARAQAQELLAAAAAFAEPHEQETT